MSSSDCSLPLPSQPPIGIGLYTIAEYEQVLAEEARKRKSRQSKLPPPTQPPPPKAAGDSNFELLNMALQVAVPMWIDRLRNTPVSSVLNAKRLEELGDVIAERGDIIMYGSKKNGRTADAFNRLAEALARLAFAPAGVTFYGVHYAARGKDDG